MHGRGAHRQADSEELARKAKYLYWSMLCAHLRWMMTSGPCDGKARRTGCMYGKVQMRSGRLRGSGRRGLSEGIVSRRRVIETGLVTTTERRGGGGGTNAENEMLTIPEHRHTVVDCASLLHFFSERRAHPVRWASTTKSCIDIV